MQLEHLAIHNNRVTGIYPPLVTHHHIGGAAQQVGNFPLALVTPLSPYDDNVGQGKGGTGPLLKTIRKFLRSRCHESKKNFQMAGRLIKIPW